MDTFVKTESEKDLSGDHIKDILDAILKSQQAPEQQKKKKQSPRVCFGKKESLLAKEKIEKGIENEKIGSH